MTRTEELSSAGFTDRESGSFFWPAIRLCCCQLTIPRVFTCMFDSLFLELEGDQTWLLGSMQSPFLMKDTYEAAGRGWKEAPIAPAREQRCRCRCWATYEVSGGVGSVQPHVHPRAGICWYPVPRQVKSSGTMCYRAGTCHNLCLLLHLLETGSGMSRVSRSEFLRFDFGPGWHF